MTMTQAATNHADAELLRRYASDRSEEAFAELVRGHISLVHSAALRQVGGNEASAADVTQAVFTELARQASRLTRHPALTGWLFTTTHQMAARHVRDEVRRQRREQEAHAMQELHRSPELRPDWNRIGPVLDRAMHDLGETDRLAVLLRHFERRPFAEVGARLGLSENAARMRVDRALEKLRRHLAKRGVTSTAAALAVALTGQAVTAAPVTLAGAVTATALAAATTTSTFGLLTLMASMKLKAGLGIALVVGVSAPLMMQHRSLRELRSQNDRLQGDLVALRAMAPTDSRVTEIVPPQTDPSELLRLRGQVAQLQREKRDLAEQLRRIPAGNANEPAGQAAAEFVLGQFEDVGAVTPDAAAQSFLWALMNANRERFSDLMDANVVSGDGTPVDRVAEFEKLAREMKSHLEADGVQIGPLKSFREFSDQSAQARFDMDDSGKRADFVLNLRKQGNQWKVQNIGKRPANEPIEHPSTEHP